MDGSWWKHLVHCIAYFLFLHTLFYAWHPPESYTNSRSVSELFESYGYFTTAFVFILRLIPMLAVPQTLANVCGLFIFNAFTTKVTLKGSALLAPFFCIRVVTRGDYPELVRYNVSRNIEICHRLGLQNFMVEVVTDKVLNLPQHAQIRETVVPKNYRTQSGALFKARALQYCLEDGVNMLSDSDWIVHLDEETQMTDSSIRGIINFISDGKYQFGQGLITYAHGDVVNWLTTCTDSMRVGEDMGKLRFQFRLFHRPLFNWKGSFIVAQASAERNVSFDYGPAGSIAEDCFFGLVASSKGYLFNFVEGVMWEKSPFTVMDFLKQRQRWLRGIFSVAFSPLIPLSNRLLVILGVFAWASTPISCLSFVVNVPIPMWRVIDFLSTVVAVTSVYLYLFGMVKTMTSSRVKPSRFLFAMGAQLLCIPLIAILENACVIYSYFGRKRQFFVVSKELVKDKSKHIPNGHVLSDRAKTSLPFDV